MLTFSRLGNFGVTTFVPFHASGGDTMPDARARCALGFCGEAPSALPYSEALFMLTRSGKSGLQAADLCGRGKASGGLDRSRRGRGIEEQPQGRQ